MFVKHTLDSLLLRAEKVGLGGSVYVYSSDGEDYVTQRGKAGLPVYLARFRLPTLPRMIRRLVARGRWVIVLAGRDGKQVLSIFHEGK